MPGGGVRARGSIAPAGTPPRVPAGTELAGRLRRADAAGQRLFRELVVSRIAWGTVREASTLVASDVVAFSLRATGCTHPPPCHLRQCFDRLQVRAVLGNRGARLPSLVVPSGAGAGGRVLAEGRPAEIRDYRYEPDLPEPLREVVAGEEGLGAVLALPISLGGEVQAVLQVGLRRPGPMPEYVAEVLGRLCGYAGAALAAAYDRARVEAVAAARERRRLARRLHDEFGQALFGISVSARLARESTVSGGENLVNHLNRLEQELARTSALLRTTLRTLDGSPTPAEALTVAVQEEAGSFTARTGVPAHLVVLGELAASTEQLDALVLRVVREGLRNVERHAEASEVVVTLCLEAASIEVVVQDDGVGAGTRLGQGGSGLRTLRAEAGRVGGTLRLTSNEDMRATLRATVPLVEG
jgi:LuxR family transcriptional regulator, regulator of acetate metabolism